MLLGLISQLKRPLIYLSMSYGGGPVMMMLELFHF